MYWYKGDVEDVIDKIDEHCDVIREELVRLDKLHDTLRIAQELIVKQSAHIATYEGKGGSDNA